MILFLKNFLAERKKQKNRESEKKYKLFQPAGTHDYTEFLQPNLQAELQKRQAHPSG